MQSLCSDLCIGCQSELGLSTRFPPCAIVAEIHLLLLTSLIFSLSTFPLSAFCRRWSHDCSTHQTQQIWKGCFFIHNLELPGIPSPNLCVMPQVLQIQSEIVRLQKASVLTTFTVRPARVLSKAEFPVYLCIQCSTCARMIVLICFFIFTVLLRYLKNLQCLGCYQVMGLLFLFTVVVDNLNNVSQFITM